MKRKSFLTALMSLLVLASLVLSACGTPEPAATPAPVEDATEEPVEVEFVPKSVSAPDCDYGGKMLEIAAVDEFTVKFTLCKPDPAFMAKVAFIPFAIQPEEWIEKTGGTGEILEKPVGTGPYAIDSWNRGDSIIFKAFDDYWGTKAKNETLVYRWATEGAARLLELQSGTVDYITNVSPDDIETVENDPNLQLLPIASPNILYLAMTNTFAPFDDVKVRQAFAMGIDRQRIVDFFYPDGSEVASHFTPCSIPGGCEGEAWYDFDATAAKALLADAGFPEGFKTAIYYRDVFRSYLPEPLMNPPTVVSTACTCWVGARTILTPPTSWTSTSVLTTRSSVTRIPKSTNRPKKLHRLGIPPPLHRSTLKPTTPSRKSFRWCPSLMVGLTMQLLPPLRVLMHLRLAPPTIIWWIQAKIPSSACRTQNPSASIALMRPMVNRWHRAGRRWNPCSATSPNPVMWNRFSRPAANPMLI